MLIDERRQHVMSLIQRDGRVLVSELSDALGISRITIRKDLDYLESKGLVQRTHGGALAPQSSTLLDPSLKEKEHHQLKEKQQIAAAAAKLTPLQDHSFRIGGTLEYLLRGLPFDTMRVKGRWASAAFLKYLRHHSEVMAPYMQANPAAYGNLLRITLPSDSAPDLV